MNYFFVYVIYSNSYRKIYIGRSNNIKERLKSHYYFATKGFTPKFRPWKLVYLESCTSLQESINREKQLKSARGRLFIWELIKNKYT